MKKIILFLVFLCLFQGQLFGQATNVIRSLSGEWLIYDQTDEIFVPYIAQIHGKTNKIHLIVAPQDYRGSYLALDATDKIFIFINNRLFYRLQKGERQYIAIDSLLAYNQQHVLVTAFRETESYALPLARIVASRESVAQKNTTTQQANVGISVRKQKFVAQGKDFLILAGLSILGILAVFSGLSFPVIQTESLSKILGTFSVNRQQVRRIDLPTVTVYAIFFSLSSAYLINLLQLRNTDTYYLQGIVETASVTNTLRFLLDALLVLLFLLAKLSLVYLLSGVYNFREMVNLHVHEFMNISKLCTFLVLILSILCNFYINPQNIVLLNILKYTALVAWFAISFIVTYRINNQVKYNKIYTFSYFCTAEFLPAILMIKFFAN